MGTEQKNGRRALVAYVQQCIEQTNTMTALASEVREANNKLAAQTEADVAELRRRLDSQAKWIAQFEGNAANQFKNHRTQVELGAVRMRAFATMTFRQRLVWLFSGRCPFFPLPWTDSVDSREAASLPREKPTTIAVGDAPARTFDGIGHMGAARAHTSLGPRVLP